MQLIAFVSGVGILLFAMQQLELSLANLGDKRLIFSLQTYTKTPLHGLFLGLIATFFFQSSSIVGLITMAFVGAGVISLKDAIGVILGSNLGTTFTGWIVAYLGFKLDVTGFYIPLIGLGSLGVVLLNKGTKNYDIARFCFAFGFLLLGLTVMKDSISFVLSYVDIKQLEDFPLFSYFVFGALLTALIQSSSATMVITLSAMSANIIELPAAAALVIGADLGTTSTVILGSLQGSIIKKQVALVHFIFNLIVDIAAFVSLPLLLLLIQNSLHISDPLYGLVAIHSSFNLIGIIVFYPFINRLYELVINRIPEPKKEELFITNVSSSISIPAIQALEKDTVNLIIESIRLNARRFNFLTKLTIRIDKDKQEKIDFTYNNLKHRENQLSDYIFDLQRNAQDEECFKRSQQLLVCIRDTLYANKAAKDINHDLHLMEGLDTKEVTEMIASLLDGIKYLYQEIINNINDPDSFSISQLSTLIESLKNTHSKSNSCIYELIDREVLRNENASTALNINREVLLSGHSMINVLEHLLLPVEQARTVSELLLLDH